ncbi:MAG TPA: TPM domain-containing protein [Gemmatimonadales bacterium]
MSRTRAKAIALAVGLQLATAALSAQAPGVDQLFPAQPVGYVNDFASVIDPVSRSSMDDLIARLRNATGAEMAVVTLPTIDDRSPNEVGVAIIRRWGIGARAAIGDSTRNAGLVILLVPRQEGKQGSGKIYVSVGQGLEGIITDAQAGQVSDLMLPELSRGDYGAGLLTGVQVLASRIARAYGVTDSALANADRATRSTGPSAGFASLLPILLFILFMVLASRGGRRRRVYWGGPWIGGGWGGGGWGGGGFGGGGFGGFGGGGGASGGGGGRSF